MPKVILLPLSGSSADGDRLATALAAGRLFDAHIVALHVRPNLGDDVLTGAMIGQARADADQLERTAAETWRTFCNENDIATVDTPQQSGLTSEWVGEIGRTVDCLVEYGRSADLIVMARDKEGLGQDTALMEAALMETGKPVLIAPAGQAVPTINGEVAIAWKDTKEAAGAVLKALPFIGKARRVTIFVVPESDGFDKSPTRLAKMLGWHNADVTIRPLLERTRSPVNVLLDAAVQAGCGLLVMGGYGHSRLREAVFGGFTREVLKTAPLPVLLAH